MKQPFCATYSDVASGTWHGDATILMAPAAPLSERMNAFAPFLRRRFWVLAFFSIRSALDSRGVVAVLGPVGAIDSAAVLADGDMVTVTGAAGAASSVCPEHAETRRRAAGSEAMRCAGTR